MQSDKPRSPTEKLLRKFAERNRPVENDLSDMLYAAMCVSQMFARDVCSLCGGDVPKNDQITVQREVTIDAGRPDLFVCDTNSRTLLVIEIKLDDKQYHWNYTESKERDKAPIALLTNHALTSEAEEEASRQGWRVLFWSKFLDSVDKNIGFYGTEADAIEAFVGYARVVTGNERLTKMNLDPDSLSSLQTFQDVLYQVVRETPVPNCKCPPGTDGYANAKHSCFGIDYQIALESFEDNSIWVSFFVYFPSAEEIWCGIELDRARNDKNRYSFIRDACSSVPKELNFEGSERKNFLWFTSFRGRDGFRTFSQKSLDDQKRQLQEFYSNTTKWLAEQLLAFRNKQN